MKKLSSAISKYSLLPLIDFLLLALITIAAYLPLFRVPFTFDAIDFIFRWNDIHSFSHIPALLLGNVPQYNEGVYRPVRSLLYVISYFFGQKNLYFYHVEELLVYLACIGLVYLVTKSLFQNRFITFTTTLFFSLHPFHVDNVANLTGSFDSFGLVFFFLSFYLFQRFLLCQKKIWFFLSLFSAFLAFFTYEVTLVLPILFILYTWYVKKPVHKQYYLSYFVLVFLYLFIRIFLLHITTRGTMFEYIPEKIAAVITTTASYIVTSFIPIPDTFSINIPLGGTLIPNPKPIQTISSLFFTKQFFFSIISLLGIGILTFSLRKKRTFIFLLLWFYISFIPIILILFQTATVTLARDIYGRYVFIPSFSACLSLGIVFHILYLQMKKKRQIFLHIFFSTLGCVYIAMLPIYFLLVTIHGIHQFKDFRTEFILAIQHIPNKAVQYNELGILQLNDRNFDGAIEDFSQALKINPNYTTAKVNLERTKKLKAIVNTFHHLTKL